MSEQAQSMHVGTVVSAENGRAVIRFSRSPMCGHCGACLAAGETEMETSVKNTLDAKPGDRVAVALSSRSFLTAGILAYALPLAGLLLGLFAGSVVSEIAAIACGLGCCALVYVLLRVLDRRFAREHTFEPHMLRLIEKTEEE